MIIRRILFVGLAVFLLVQSSPISYADPPAKPRIDNVETGAMNKGAGIYYVEFEVSIDRVEIEPKIGNDGTYHLFSFPGCSFTDVLGEPKPGAEGKSVFLHPRGTFGVLVELVEKEE